MRLRGIATRVVALGTTSILALSTLGIAAGQPALAFVPCDAAAWEASVNPVGEVTADDYALFSWEPYSGQGHFTVRHRRFSEVSGWSEFTYEFVGPATSFRVPFFDGNERSSHISLGVSGWCVGGPDGPDGTRRGLPSQIVTVRSVPPSAPGSVGVSVVGSAVDVEWSSPSDWGGANELSYRVSTSPESGTCEVVAVGACRLEDVPRGVPLTVQVIASNVAGSSAPASSAPVTVPVTAPDSPGVVTAKYPKPGTAKVSWTAPANDGGKPITRYTVTAKPGKQTCSTSGTQSCVIKGLTSGKSYSFTVKAKNAIGTSAASPAGVAGVLVGPSSSPRKVNASPSGGSATISWNKPSKSGGGKLVEYVARAGSQTCTTKKKKCKINGLALGRTYQVTVTAVTTGGRSKPATTTVTTIAPIPPKPQQDIT